MGSNFKSWLYIIGGMFIIGTITVLAIQLLVWALPIMLVLYVIYKLKRYINIKGVKKSNNNFNNTYQKKSNYNSDYVGKVDDSIGEIIDVEYQDINK